VSFHWKQDAYAKHPELIKKIHRLVEQAPMLFVRREDGRIDHKTEEQGLDSPWIFIRNDPTRHCHLWNAIYWNALGLMPTFCRFCCWKVVVKPQTVKDLFRLYKVFWNLGVNGKIGLDIRDYTEAIYAGFIYNDSKADGQEMLQKVRQALYEHFGDHMPPSFLKRGCTEMELSVPSDQWDTVTPEELEKEEMLNEIFMKHEVIGGESPWMIEDRKSQFIKYAISVGDPTWRDLVEDPSQYVPHTVKYDDYETFQATMSPGGSEKAYENQ